jgi:HEPN domain-containing protein
MNRDELKELASIRLKEAQTLLKAGRPDGAYYLAGYAVECALKACIAKQTQRYDFPDKNRANDSWKHDLASLVGTANLKTSLDQEIRSNPQFDRNWAVVKDWNEKSRYRRSDSRVAQDILAAIADRRNGVLKWLRRYW